MIQRLNKVVADLNKENRQLTDENKKLKETAATDGTALAKEKAEKANLKEANSKLQVLLCFSIFITLYYDLIEIFL